MTPLEQLSRLAPTLKEAELRVLLYLSARAMAEGGIVVAASSREIASALNCSRSKLQAALDSLAARSLIATRQGSATKPSVHQLNFLDTVILPGSLKEPPSRFSGPLREPPLASLWGHPGSLSEPPPTEYKGLTGSEGRVDLDGLLTFEGILDRMHAAKPKDFDENTSTKCRQFLHSYMAKLGTRDALANGVPHPPDVHLVARFLSLGQGVGEWPRLERLLYDLMGERKEVASYGWFVTVAMQRIHGVSATVQRAHREKIRLLKSAGAEPAARTGAGMVSAASLAGKVRGL